MSVPVSVFIIALNEADRIVQSIDAVKSWVDEVVVVDSGSSDDTVDVSKKAGAKVEFHEWNGFGQQKRFAETLCRNDWILNIDADEVVTDDLRREIEALFAAGAPTRVAYGMAVDLVYPGQSKPRLWAQDHWCVRLYDRRKVRFRDSALHDSVVTEGFEVGRLRGTMHHFSMRSFEDMEAKFRVRIAQATKDAHRRSAASLTPRLITELPVNFLKYYIGRRHFTGGLTGFRYAWRQALFRFQRVYELWKREIVDLLPRKLGSS